MIKGSDAELKEIAQNYTCPEHPDAVLTVAWHQLEKCLVIRCGEHYPEEVKRVPTLTELHKQGVELPEPIKSNIEKRLARQQAPIPTGYEAVTMGGIPAADLGTGELIPVETLKALGKWAQVRGLRPELGHVVLMYGRPYPTIDGFLYHARASHQEVGLSSRPLTAEERADAMIPEGAHAWMSTALVGSERAVFTGIGIVPLDEMTERSKRNPNQLAAPVVAKHPWQMAQKRADWQALRRAFPLGEEEANGQE